MKKKPLLILLICLCVLVLAGTAVLIWYFASYRPKQERTEQYRKIFNDYYNAKVESFATQNAENAGRQIDVVFLGDSLTDGYDLARYYPQYVTLNRGINGDTTVGLENRLDVSVYQVKPKVAVMLIGVNNLATMLDNYESILQGFKANIPDTKIVLLSLTSMADYWAYNNQLAAYTNAYIKRYAQLYGYTFVDLYTPLFDVTTGEMKCEYTVDGGHFTHEGYTVLTDAITPVLASLLGY